MCLIVAEPASEATVVEHYVELPGLPGQAYLTNAVTEIAAAVKALADNGIELELGVWIGDPEKGQANLRSELLLAIWKASATSRKLVICWNSILSSLH